MPSPSTWLPRIALLLASMALPAGCAELYLRHFEPVSYRMPPRPMPHSRWHRLVHRKSNVPGLSYDLTPSRRVKMKRLWIETNRLGLRSYEPMGRDPHRTRIAVVGDSYTFGFGVKMPDAFSAVMERRLNGLLPNRIELSSETSSYEVMNFGVGGYSTLDEAAVVEHRVKPWAPRLIVLAYTLNDPENTPLQPVHSYYQDVQLWQYSHLLRRIARTHMQMSIRHFGNGDYHRYLHAAPAKWKSVPQGFARIAVAARSMGAEVLLAIFPHCKQMHWDAYPYRELHAQVAGAGHAAGFHVLDLLATMERQTPLSVRARADDDHPNRRGHRMAGEELAKYLQVTGLLDEPEKPGAGPAPRHPSSADEHW